MFKILIVEDNTEKLIDIISTLTSIDGIEEEDIENVVDAFSAKGKLTEKTYDLLILDIAIPLRRTEPIDIEGGIKLLNEIIQREQYKVPTHIIGLTAKEDIFEKAKVEFGLQILSVIPYSISDIEWQSLLKNGVIQRCQSKLSSLKNEESYNYDIAIITAVEREFDAVKKLGNEWKRVDIPFDSSPYYETTFEENDKIFRVVAACAPKMGMNSCGVLSMKLIYNFRPRYLFMTGIAASIKDIETHGYGDIIVIDESWDGGAGKITQSDDGENIFHPSANHLRLDNDISEKMRGFKSNTEMLRKIKDEWKPNDAPNTELSIHIGSVTSVAGVIENEAVLNELKIKDRKLLGLEMEAYAMYNSAHGCSRPKPVPIAMKSVSDFANTGKNDKYQNYAAYTSARVMYEFIISEL